MIEEKPRPKVILYAPVADESPQCESGRADGSTDGRNPSAPKFPKGDSYNPWRVLRVAVLTALSPERMPRCLSPEAVTRFRGRGRISIGGREVLLPGAGPMGTQMPPAGSVGVLNRRGINSPAPRCTNVHFG